jgi:hypothetical protein
VIVGWAERHQVKEGDWRDDKNYKWINRKGIVVNTVDGWFNTYFIVRTEQGGFQKVPIKYAKEVK